MGEVRRNLEGLIKITPWGGAAGVHLRTGSTNNWKLKTEPVGL